MAKIKTKFNFMPLFLMDCTKKNTKKMNGEKSATHFYKFYHPKIFVMFLKKYKKRVPAEHSFFALKEAPILLTR